MDIIKDVEDSELTKYVWNHYHHLSSRLEQLSAKAVLAEYKANSSSSNAMAKLIGKICGEESTPEVMAVLSAHHVQSNVSRVAIPGMFHHWIGRQSFRMVNCPRHLR